eukprot:scaffold518663_cov39-Prasinocladus_malaysianus.AAC.2
MADVLIFKSVVFRFSIQLDQGVCRMTASTSLSSLLLCGTTCSIIEEADAQDGLPCASGRYMYSVELPLTAQTKDQSSVFESWYENAVRYH